MIFSDSQILFNDNIKKISSLRLFSTFRSLQKCRKHRHRHEDMINQTECRNVLQREIIKRNSNVWLIIQFCCFWVFNFPFSPKQTYSKLSNMNRPVVWWKTILILISRWESFEFPSQEIRFCIDSAIRSMVTKYKFMNAIFLFLYALSGRTHEQY